MVILASAFHNALPDAGQGWRIYYVFFSRAGFTEAAQVMAREYEAILLDSLACL
jgi:hypothetical protein